LRGSLKNPIELWAGFGVLAYFALVSIVVPVAMLSRRPVPRSPLARDVVVLLFVTGFAGLLGYVVWSIRRLHDVGDGSDQPT